MYYEGIVKLRDIMRLVAAGSAAFIALGAGSAFANVDVEGSNDTTGPNSANENEWNIDHAFDVAFDNQTDLAAFFDIDFSSGENDFDSNTSIGDIEVGDALVLGEVTNEVGGVDDLDLGDLLDSDVSADFSNDTTGSRSDNRNELNVDHDIDVDLNSETNIETALEADLETGNNDVSNNTLVGDFTSGDIRMDFTVDNVVESGGFGLDLGGLGGGSVDAVAENDLTGPNSRNTNEVNVDHEVDVEVDTQTDIATDVAVSGNSGNNDVENNTLVGDVETGSIGVQFTVNNQVQ